MPGHKGGESEIIIGKWLKARGDRGKVVIASKVGMEMPGIGQGLSKAYIMARVEDSLKRLQTDYIDLYQSHADDKATPIEETLATYEQLIKQGKVRAIGASNFDAAAPGRGAQGERRQQAAALRDACSRSTTCPSAPTSRRSCSRCASRRTWRVIPFYRAGVGLPDRQVPDQGRSRQAARAAAASRSTSTSAACAS